MHEKQTCATTQTYDNTCECHSTEECVGATGCVGAGTPSGTDHEEGSTTVEYAIGALATAGFAGLLVLILKSGSVQAALETIITNALTVAGG